MHLKVWKLLHDSPNLAVLHLCHLLERGHVREAELVTSDQDGPHPPPIVAPASVASLAQAAQLQDPVMSPQLQRCPHQLLYSTMHSCCGHLLTSRRGPSLSPGCRRRGDMSSVQQFSFPQQTSSGPAVVAGGGRPSTTTTTGA